MDVRIDRMLMPVMDTELMGIMEQKTAPVPILMFMFPDFGNFAHHTAVEHDFGTFDDLIEYQPIEGL